MSKPRGTDGSLLASLPWTLVALAVSVAPHIVYLPLWITGALLFCGGWRYVIERRRSPLPSPWLRAALALVCFLGVLATYSSISGVGPGSALLAVMAALKLLETRRRRDQFVLLFISIFLVMSSLLREQYLWSLPYMIATLALILTAWLHMSAAARETAARSFRTGVRLMLYAAPLAITMWILFPRISTPFWAVPIDTSRGTSGLSETMSPGDISSLSLSDAVAFRVSFDDRIPDARDRYWRGLVLTRFNGRTWSGPDEARRGVRVEEQIAVGGNPVRYRVTLEPTSQQWIFALDMPYAWNLPQAFMTPQQTLARVFPIDQRIAYEVVSYPEYESGSELPRLFRGWYTGTPERSNPKTAELARELRAASGSDAEYIDAVLRKFNQEAYYYTLEPPPLGNNPVDRFLFDTRRGFCEHYASAFAVLMRSAGIPARIVLGYQGGEINPMGGHMIVRQSDAHAWTEVWLDGVGWRRVDPTAAVAPERIDAGMRGALLDGIGASWGLAAPSEILHRLQLTWDAVDAKWNEWVLGYGPENQDLFLKWLGMNNPDWRNKMLTLVASVIGLIVMISMLLMLRYKAPKKDRALLLYSRFVRKTGIAPAIGETPSKFAVRAATDSPVPVEAIDTVTAAYLDARYGSGNPSAIDDLESCVRKNPVSFV